MKPYLIKGDTHIDHRGILKYNNCFDMEFIKRMYIIQNINTSFIRGWQGHKTEQRWFSAITGEFKINLMKIDNWNNPSKALNKQTFYLNDKSSDVLHVPNGYVSSIQASIEQSKLLVMSNYNINEINDEYRFPIAYFKNS